MIGFSEKNWSLATAGLGFLLLVLVTLGLSCAQDEGNKKSGPQMQKHVTREANFVLYIPKGWICNESVQPGVRTLVVTDPSKKYEAVISYGRNPNGDDLLALAKFFIDKIGRQFPHLQLRNSMISRDRNRIVFDGFYTDPRKGKREFRSWLSGRDGNFIYSKVEAPEGKLVAKRQLLLTILSNVHVIKAHLSIRAGLPYKKRSSTIV